MRVYAHIGLGGVDGLVALWRLVFTRKQAHLDGLVGNNGYTVVVQNRGNSSLLYVETDSGLIERPEEKAEASGRWGL